MKIGVVGCGGIGRTHYLSLKVLSSRMDLEVAALADCREEFLEKAREYFPDARTYSDGMDLIEREELDAVHICLPSYLHADHVVAAMQKGMNVFVEKPVCLTSEDARMILDAEKKTGVKAMVGQVVRSFEEYRYLKDVYEKKVFGNLKSIVMQRMSGDVRWGYEDWFHDDRRSGSVVMDLHVHDLDFLRYMLGEPDHFDVRAAAFENGVINQIITTCEFGNVFAEVEGCWDVSPALEFTVNFRACFEKATVIFAGSNSPTLKVYRKDGTVEVPDLKTEFDTTGNEAGINVSGLGPYCTEIKYFLDCLIEDKPVEVAPVGEGIKSVELALKVWEAAKEYVEKRRSFIRNDSPETGEEI